MISFSLYPEFENKDLNDLREVFQIDNESDDTSDLKVKNITALR